jgi:hypothetical protein
MEYLVRYHYEKGIFYSTILTISLFLGTRRDPSAFEFSTTAPAILSVTETPELVAMVSTTRLGIQRSKGYIDTYVPGTLLSDYRSERNLKLTPTILMVATD